MHASSSQAHFYDTYETLDGKYISIGSIEGKFYKLLLKLGGMEHIPQLSRQSQFNMTMWAENKERIKSK